MDSNSTSRLTDVGRMRDHNEDNFLVDKKLALFVVADGMGGHAAGEVASAIAVRTIHEEMKQRARAARRLRGGRDAARARHDKDILALARARGAARLRHASTRRRRPTRTSAAWARPRRRCSSSATHGFIAHVGDSRIYLLRAGAHPAGHRGPHALQRAHQAREAHAASRSRRSRQKNAITRAVGVYERVEVDTLDIEVLARRPVPARVATGCTDTSRRHRRARRRTLAEADGDAARQGAHRRSPTSAAARTTSPPSSCASARARRSDDDRAKRLALKRERAREDAALRAPRRARAAPRHAGRRGARVRAPARSSSREGDKRRRALHRARGQGATSSRGRRDAHRARPGRALRRDGAHPQRAALRDRHRRQRPAELIAIRRSDFFEILRKEHELAVKLLWQFLGVLADRLATPAASSAKRAKSSRPRTSPTRSSSPKKTKIRQTSKLPPPPPSLRTPPRS